MIKNKVDINKTYLDGRIYFIKHKGKDVLYVDYSNKRGEEFCEFAIEVYSWAVSHEFEPNSVLNIGNYHNTIVTHKSIGILKKLSRDVVKPYCRKNAVVGVKPVQKIFIIGAKQFSGVDIECFDTNEEALEWIVK